MPGLRKKVMDLNTYIAILDHLFAQGIADTKTNFGFYNWGEPLLNPEFNKIVEYMYDNKLSYHFSTNGSVPLKETWSHAVFGKCTSVILSFPGFSQNSYDRIHGFRFDKIKSNVEKIISTLKRYGCKDITMNYHCYQFNLGSEYWQAKKFCADEDISFVPTCAYINDYERSIGYLNGTLNKEDYKTIGENLLLFYVKDLIEQRSEQYECPEFKRLTIDENGNVLPCCVPQNEILGNIFDLTSERLEIVRRQATSCIECRKYGEDYWAHHPHPYHAVQFKEIAKISVKSKLGRLRRYL